MRRLSKRDWLDIVCIFAFLVATMWCMWTAVMSGPDVIEIAPLPAGR